MVNSTSAASVVPLLILLSHLREAVAVRKERSRAIILVLSPASDGLLCPKGPARMSSTM